MRKLFIFILIIGNVILSSCYALRPLDRYQVNYNMPVKNADYKVLEHYDFPAFMDSLYVYVVETDDQESEVFDISRMEEGLNQKAVFAMTFFDDSYENKYGKKYFNNINNDDCLSRIYDSSSSDAYITVIYHKPTSRYYVIVHG